MVLIVRRLCSEVKCCVNYGMVNWVYSVNRPCGTGWLVEIDRGEARWTIDRLGEYTLSDWLNITLLVKYSLVVRGFDS